MNVEWHRAPTQREAYFADVAGRRLFVQQSRRSISVDGHVPREFEAFVCGIRVGEFATTDGAKMALLSEARRQIE